MRLKESSVIPTFDSRRKRREAINAILASLSAIREAEQKYLENVPESFQHSESFEAGEFAVDALDEAIGLLSDVY